MGEAKRRKLASSNDAKSSTSTDQRLDNPDDESHHLSNAKNSFRGLIVSAPTEINDGRIYLKLAALDPQELRLSVLLWDQLVWPKNNIIHIQNDNDADFLQSAGFLTTPKFFSSSFDGQSIIKAQVDAFNANEKQNPGSWSIAQGERSLTVLGGEVKSGNNLCVRLNSAIPVPNSDVPLSEVLDFKTRRNAELLALRAEIDSLAKEIEASGDEEQAIIQQIARIDKACADAIKAGSEWKFPVRLVNYKPTFEFRPFSSIAGGIVGVLGGNAIPMTASQSALAALAGVSVATAPAVKLAFDGIEWRGLRDRSSPFHYVCQFHKELF